MDDSEADEVIQSDEDDIDVYEQIEMLVADGFTTKAISEILGVRWTYFDMYHCINTC